MLENLLCDLMNSGADYYFYEDKNGGHFDDSLTSYEEALPPALKYMYLYRELGMIGKK